MGERRTCIGYSVQSLNSHSLSTSCSRYEFIHAHALLCIFRFELKLLIRRSRLSSRSRGSPLVLAPNAPTPITHIYLVHTEFRATMWDSRSGWSQPHSPVRSRTPAHSACFASLPCPHPRLTPQSPPAHTSTCSWSGPAAPAFSAPFFDLLQTYYLAIIALRSRSS